MVPRQVGKRFQRKRRDQRSKSCRNRQSGLRTTPISKVHEYRWLSAVFRSYKLPNTAFSHSKTSSAVVTNNKLLYISSKTNGSLIQWLWIWYFFVVWDLEIFPNGSSCSIVPLVRSNVCALQNPVTDMGTVWYSVNVWSAIVNQPG